MRVHLLLLAVSIAIPSAAADKETQIDALIARYHDQGWFNGSALVAEGGQPLFRKGYGLADMEWGIPNAPDTKFRLGSVTKQFTAALVLQMVEQGRIELNAPLTRYLPDYPRPGGDKVTIHHLLNHTSGIPGYTEIPGWADKVREPYRPLEFLQVFASQPLFFEPGTRFSYSNSGYFLLGVILEKLSGRSYADLLHAKIFEPAGMADSGYDLSGPLIARRAAGYDATLDGFRNTDYLDMTQPYSAGSLYSTVEDLYRWDQALYGDRILAEKSRQEMFRPGLSNYGYGWIIRKGATTRISHGGGINGFNTLIVREPETRRLVVLLNNTGGAPLDRISQGIFAILEGREAEVPRPPASPALYQTYQRDGLDATIARIKELRSAAAPALDAGDEQLMRLAGHLLSQGKTGDALALAELSVQYAPKSPSAAALLANAHRAAGHRADAIQAYGKAIELSPNPRQYLILADQIRQLAAVP